MEIKYSIIIGYNEETNYSIVMDKFTLLNGIKNDIASVIQNNLTFEECLTLQTEFIK